MISFGFATSALPLPSAFQQRQMTLDVPAAEQAGLISSGGANAAIIAG